METIQAELRKSMHYLSMKKRDHAADKIDALQAQVEALTAELESWRFTNRIDELQRAHDIYKKDAERLDWLNSQGVAYGFQQTHEGNKWEIEGPFRNLRVAIDDCRASIDREIAK